MRSAGSPCSRLLLAEPHILLLDEPTNHLDAESVDWLEQHLRQCRSTVIAVTHDRYFLDNVAGWILELDRGEGIPYKGNYAAWLEAKQTRLAMESKSESKYQKTLARELEWVRMGAKGRQAKSKARLRAYDEMLDAAPEKREADLEIYIPPGPRLGDVVIDLKGVSKAYGEKLLFENLTFSLPRNGIVGVIGPNGAGKTTLFRLITRKEKPDTGEVRVGESVQLSYVDQERDSLALDRPVWEAVSGRRGHRDGWQARGQRQTVRVPVQLHRVGPAEARLRAFGRGTQPRAHGPDAQEGQRALLDEPTNDLDVHTLRALEEAIQNFAGCCVIISHDRWFLDRVATHILAFEGDSQVRFFEGNYQAYEEDRKARLGNAATPSRIRYKKLTRN